MCQTKKKCCLQQEEFQKRKKYFKKIKENEKLLKNSQLKVIHNRVSKKIDKNQLNNNELA